MSAIKILNFYFVNKKLEEFSNLLINNIKNNKKSFIITLNSEGIILSRKNYYFAQALKKANYICADGMGILLAAKLFKIHLPPRVTGIDLMVKLCKKATKNKFKIFLLGSTERNLRKTKNNLLKKFPNLQICGTQHGFFKNNEILGIISKINAAKSDILFVALGMPKQEIWIAENIDKLTPKLFIGVGGSFDVISGEFQRAPEILQKLALEWFYRLVQDPKRVRRTFGAITEFIFLVFKEKYFKNN